MLIIRTLLLALSTLCSIAASAFVIQRVAFGDTDITSLLVAIVAFTAMGVALITGLIVFTSRSDPMPKRIVALLDLRA